MYAHDEAVFEVDRDPGVDAKASYRMTPYWTCWTPWWQPGARCSLRGLGVNYRTLASSAGLPADAAGAGGVSGRLRCGLGSAGRRAGCAGGGLEGENAGLRELVAGRERELGELRRRVGELQGGESSAEDAGPVGGGHDQVDVQRRDRRPPRRRPGQPDAGVVTLEEQPDEDHAFGSGAALVAEWRRLRAGGGEAVSCVDRVQVAVRRWELEAELLGEYHLTLPPDTYPLDDARRADQVRWRRDALAEARRELGWARRVRLLRRVLTLGRAHRMLSLASTGDA